MPITHSATKALRQTKKRTALNNAKKKRIKELMKQVEKAVASKAADTVKLVQSATKALDKAAKTHTIHANRAARLKSQLQKKLRTLQ